MEKWRTNRRDKGLVKKRDMWKKSEGRNKGKKGQGEGGKRGESKEQEEGGRNKINTGGMEGDGRRDVMAGKGKRRGWRVRMTNTFYEAKFLT